MTEWNKTVPEMSADFCNRVVAASRDVWQKHPFSLRAFLDRVATVLPVRPNWAIMAMAVVFVVGIVAGLESYSITGIAEILEI
ncbi:MAG: hypothetical protein FWC51_03730 [Proteobacteria bacterium]|nr:hypothetical protein [Pseudomonadota bacterium]